MQPNPASYSFNNAYDCTVRHLAGTETILTDVRKILQSLPVKFFSLYQ